MKTMDEGKYDTNIKIAILTTLVKKKNRLPKEGEITKIYFCQNAEMQNKFYDFL